MMVSWINMQILFILVLLCHLLAETTSTTKHLKSNVTPRVRDRKQFVQDSPISLNSRKDVSPPKREHRREKTRLNASYDNQRNLGAEVKSADSSLSRFWNRYTGANKNRLGINSPSQRRQVHVIHLVPQQARGNVVGGISVFNSTINIDSGLNVRLRRNSSVNEGLVEVKVNGQWGFICNDHQWNADDVQVLCRQLGFSSTAETLLYSLHGVRTMRTGSSALYSMSNVSCSGSEKRIHDCQYNTDSSCSTRKQVRVRCALSSGCERDWLAGNDFCYKLVKSATTFDEAKDRCQALGAHLIKIETPEENDFVSNLLMAESAEGAVWTSGYWDQSRWIWFRSAYAFRFSKWFPGWQDAGLPSEPRRTGNQYCIALSKSFSNKSDSRVFLLDYYFWMTVPCGKNLPFVCKKIVQTDDCYEGNGISYRGTAFITTSMSLCQNWSLSTKMNQTTFPNAGLGDHNFCRNPDGDESPWCWVDAANSSFGYCALSQCPGSTELRSTPSTLTNDNDPVMKVRLVGGRDINEGRVEVWHDGEWGNVCDDHWGFVDADVVCRQLGFAGAERTSILHEFSAGSGVNILLDEVRCTVYDNALHECSHSPWGEHDCRPYEVAGVVCAAKRVCVAEKEIQCMGDRGPICLPLAYVCDREEDCSDGSDEENCDGIRVTLVNGRRESEGRVEITINNITGTLCDDDWDDDDAAVICRMLGFSGERAQAVTGAQFGLGRGPIWLDNVDCSGFESDLSSCQHPPLGEHNCMHNEDAGVSCLATDRTLPPRASYSLPSVNCGRRPIQQPQAKIIGGQYAVYGAYPWQARILKINEFGIFTHSCGGTVIHQNWILSAAHCFESFPKEHFRVRVGDYRTNAVDTYEQEFALEKVIKHPRYSNLHLFFFGSAQYDYDIALVKVQSTNSRSSIQFSNYIQPACLPSASVAYTPGLFCEVSGWGVSGRNTPQVLRSATIPIRHRSECQLLYRHRLSSKMFCAGYRDGHADTCQGDSGGPLVCYVNGTYTIMGITSWGHGCGIPNSPGIYTKVGELTDWILQTIKRQ